MTSERVGGPEPESESALFHRRIEFHAARKPFNGFGSGGSNGFKLVTLNPNAEQHKAVKKFEKAELMETGFDPELSFEITFRRIGAGLRNLGNTCFLNSVLQCLTYTEPLAAYLQSGKHQNSCRNAGFCALCAIQKHVSRALQATGRILEPKDLVSNLRCISRSFRNARQEDAHEYMVNLLESMHKCCLPSGVPSESPGAYDRSLVHKIFGGRLRSQVKCMQCSFCSNKFDPFLDLSLEIVKADSLLKALAHFTAKEQLDGGAKQYQCQQCKQKVRALKQLTIHKAPHVLTVHLKRFGSHAPGQKIDRKVSFGPTLDLKPFVTGPYDGDLKYTLYGVLVHAGWSTHSGHYYCFVRTSSGMWYNLDDNQVVQVSERKVLEQKAYMLFYVRDRRNSFTKKPVDIKKENMVMSTVGNGALSKFNKDLKEINQNGSIEKRADGSLSGRDAMVATETKETPLKKLPSQNVNASIDVGNAGLKKEICSVVKSNIVGLKGESCSTAEVKNSSSVSKDSNLPQDSLPKKESSDSVTICETSDSKIMLVEPIAEALDKVNIVKSSQQNSIGEVEVGGAPMKTGEEIHENGSSVAQEQLSLVVTKNKKPKLKVKRKLFKYQVATMTLSANIIFGVGLCLQKKKHKLRKHSSEKKKGNFASDGKNKNLGTQNGIKPSEVIKNEFRESVSLKGTSHSAEKQPPVMQSAGNSEDCQRESRQTGVMSMLTRGLDETTVARWDDIDISFSVKSETRAAGTAPIGYVGDEWDEEYDRGKRKKIRDNKISFDGPNLFQEAATRNLKRKKAKLDKSSYRNQPFRI